MPVEEALPNPEMENIAHGICSARQALHPLPTNDVGRHPNDEPNEERKIRYPGLRRGTEISQP